MTEFSILQDGDDGYGRLGRLSVRNGAVQTPALFPVINLIGGTTLDSGSSWRHFRDNILDEDDLQGIMFQAMSFLDYGLTADNLADWREKTFREHFEDRVDVNAPIFIDSGGFKLMNSKTFGDPPAEGDEQNDWRLYTNPDSILKLQADFGADIIATLDYPIPPDLNVDEQEDRMEQSIESAVRCLKLIENPDEIEIRSEADKKSVQNLKAQKQQDEPAVFVAIHGHDYDTIHWYVMNFLERIEEEGVEQPFQGFAIGSLVPLRSKVDVLVDIVQGAIDAISEERRDEIALHVFGVGGKQASLLSLLGVDTFDCSSHMQTAQYAKYLIPGEWNHLKLSELTTYTGDNTFPCDIPDCPLCSDDGPATDEEGHPLTPDKLNEYLQREPTYGVDGFTKSKYYGWLARHNFEVYNREIREVQQAIADGRLLDYVIEFAQQDADIRRGLKKAQVRDSQLQRDIEARDAYELLPGPDVASDQAKLSDFNVGIDEIEDQRTISLEHSPSDFNVLTRNYTPPEREYLLVLPCSKTKPYAESQTQRAVLNKLTPIRESVHKVTVSGMYGPVPEEFEEEPAIKEYEYVLSAEDEKQVQLVTERLTEYLNVFGGQYDEIVGYATSKNYRQVIEDAFTEHRAGTVFPRDPRARRFREHFRNANIRELTDHMNVSVDATLGDLE
ncbi:tRNA-guanine transglycosylase [Halorussus amylolyticus]|uniref:tRNA-guanine transglycosylase n=1 Tax=Halorussus amylolyticus TaxID=1126242 RepID=UPI00138EF855|nr:tRNA-guanine transglycosylase [Halorussus amylolyticus]